MSLPAHQVLTMQQAAAAVGLSYERFRKVRRRLQRERGFPAPFAGTRWDAAAIAKWRARQSDPAAEPAPARPAATPEARGARAWAQLERMREA